MSPPHLVDVELALPPRQLPVAGGELTDEVVAVGRGCHRHLGQGEASGPPLPPGSPAIPIPVVHLHLDGPGRNGGVSRPAPQSTALHTSTWCRSLHGGFSPSSSSSFSAGFGGIFLSTVATATSDTGLRRQSDAEPPSGTGGSNGRASGGNHGADGEPGAGGYHRDEGKRAQSGAAWRTAALTGRSRRCRGRAPGWRRPARRGSACSSSPLSCGRW